MKAMLVALMLAGLQPKSGDPLPEGFRFNGGPHDGLATKYVTNGKGQRLVGFAPSQTENAPIAPAVREAVNALIKSYEVGDTEIYKKYVAPDVEAFVGCNYVCGPSSPFTKFPFGDGNNIHANSVFHIDQGQMGPVVRVEWLHENDVWYLSYIYFNGDKVYRVSSMKANVPSVHIEGS